MDKVEFATLVFQGARFNDARMPVDVLPELAAYRSLLLAVAKAIFKRRHPRRERVDRGFESGFQLYLDRVEEGSSVVDVMSRGITTAIPPLFAFGTESGYETGDVFEIARDVVEAGIAAAGNDTALPADLSAPEVLARFSVFGKTLQRGERVIVAKPRMRTGATYDRDVRQKLIRMSRLSYEDDVDLLGEVREADKDKATFFFGPSEEERYPVSPAPAFLPAFLRLFERSVTARLRGLGIYTADGDLQKITSITDFSEEGGDSVLPGCPTRVSTQLESLAALPAEWLDETGGPYATGDLSWLDRLLNAVLVAFSVPTPYIYPAPDGVVRAEWSSHDEEVIARFDLHAKTVEVMAVRDVETFYEHTIDFKEAGAEAQFGQFLSEHLA